MAASSKEFMDEVSEEFLSCKICMQSYKSPKSLVCMHTFCESCLDKHLDAEQDKKYRFRVYVRTLSCPLCRAKTEVPNGGVRKLPDNFLLSNLIEIFEKRKTAGAKAPLCEICKPNGRYSSHQAVSKCLECNKMLCRKCVNLHKSTKVTQSHSLYDADVEKDIKCKIHPEESVRFYCEPCQQCICILCTFQEHKDHEITSFSDGLAKYQNCLDELLSTCRDRIGDIKDHLNLIQTSEVRIKETEDLIRDTAINAISAIRKRERLMTQDLRKFVGQETYDFIQQKDYLRDNLEKLQRTCDLTDIILKEPSIELLLLKKDIQSKLETLTQQRLTRAPYNLQQKVKFIPGPLNFGFLEIDGRPPFKKDIVEEVGCPCSLCTAPKVDQETLTDAVPLMKYMTQTGLTDVVGTEIQTRLPDLIKEGFASGHPTDDTAVCDNAVSDSNHTRDLNGNSDSQVLSEQLEHPNISSASCQTDSELLEAFMVESNFVFQYNVSKVLPEKVDAETSANIRLVEDTTEIEDTTEVETETAPPEFKSVGCDPVFTEILQRSESLNNDRDLSADLKVRDYRKAYVNDKARPDTVQTTVPVTTEPVKRIETKDASVSTIFSNLNPLEKGCSTEKPSKSDASTSTKVRVRDIGILKRPHTITRSTLTLPKRLKSTGTETLGTFNKESTICLIDQSSNTDPVVISSTTVPEKPKIKLKDRGVSPIRFKTTCRATSTDTQLKDRSTSVGCGEGCVTTEDVGSNTPILSKRDQCISTARTNVRTFGTQMKPTSRNIGIDCVPAMVDSGVGTPRVILRDKDVGTPHVTTTEKETATTQVHTMHRAIETDSTIMYDKAVDTHVADVTKAYLDAVGTDVDGPIKVRKVTRATCTPQVQMATKETSTTDDQETQSNSEEFFDCGSVLNVESYTVNPALEWEAKYPEGKQTNNSNNIQQNEEESQKSKRSFFSGRRFSLPKVLTQRVDKGMNTKSITTEHKGTYTPPPETKDVAVTTDFTTRVDDKITQCISKLKNVSQKLEVASPNTVSMAASSSPPTTTPATVTMVTSAEDIKPSPSARPRFSFLSSLLGRRQSEGDIRKAERKLEQQEILARKKHLTVSQMLRQGSLESLPEESESDMFSFPKPKLSVQTKVVPRLGSAEELASRPASKAENNGQTGSDSVPKQAPSPPTKPPRPKIKMGKPLTTQGSPGGPSKTPLMVTGERKAMPITRVPSPNTKSKNRHEPSHTRPVPSADAKPPLPPPSKHSGKGAKH